MTWPRRTAVFVVAIIVLCIGWDVVAALLGGEESTISYVVASASYRWPVVAFAGGFLAAHLWWRMRANVKEQAGDRKP